MRFTVLLFALGQILKLSSFFHRAFKRYIRKAKVRILVKTADGERARVFVFNKGKVCSFPGNHDEFDAALIFTDVATGVSVMTSKEKDASFNAAAEGKLTIEGMGFYAQWFEDGTRLIL